MPKSHCNQRFLPHSLSLLFSLLAAMTLHEKQGFGQAESAFDLLSKAIKQRQGIKSLDVEIDVKGRQRSDYEYVARCTHSGEMRRVEMWNSGVRTVNAFNGTEHLNYVNESEQSAAVLTNASIIVGKRAYEIVDARKIGMLPMGFMSVDSMNVEEMYFSNEARMGSVTELGNGVYMVSWNGTKADSNWRIWVDSTKNYCVVRCEVDWKDGDDRYNDKVDLVVEKQDDDYFPIKVDYKRTLNDKEKDEEACLIKVLAINTQFDEEFFSIENAGLPKYLGVFRIPESTEMMYWDGTNLLTLAELKEREVFWERMRWATAISLGLVIFGLGLVWLRRRKK
ncbi:MAG: hypothetical protein Q8M16_09200 [Pirellulaceae bacterium]|nr:hypothetical protein [Pirellulaceae bacterium]